MKVNDVQNFIAPVFWEKEREVDALRRIIRDLGIGESPFK